MGKFYAVKRGRTTGIFNSWDECKNNTDGYPSAEFKSFKTAGEAAEYLGFAAGGQKHEEPEERHCSGTSERRTLGTETGRLVAYVDGSYNTATKEYGYGAVLLRDDGSIEELYERGNDEELAAMRNVAGEIKGAEAAMRYAVKHGCSELIIYHDYEGIAKWCQGLWKTNKEGTREYKRIYDEMSKSLNIKFVKVKGHSGDKYNDMADILAKKAAGILLH